MVGPDEGVASVVAVHHVAGRAQVVVVTHGKPTTAGLGRERHGRRRTLWWSAPLLVTTVIELFALFLFLYEISTTSQHPILSHRFPRI